MSKVFKRFILFLAFIALVMGTLFAVVSHDSVEGCIIHLVGIVAEPVSAMHVMVRDWKNNVLKRRCLM